MSNKISRHTAKKGPERSSPRIKPFGIGHNAKKAILRNIFRHVDRVRQAIREAEHCFVMCLKQRTKGVRVPARRLPNRCNFIRDRHSLLSCIHQKVKKDTAQPAFIFSLDLADWTNRVGAVSSTTSVIMATGLSFFTV